MVMTVSSSTLLVGPAIQMCQKEDLDAFDISWPEATAANTIENFTFDERNPTLCYVYPPAGANSYVELVYVADPTDCASTSSNLSVADQYQTALRYLVLSVAYEKDIEGANPERAAYYLQAAKEELGMTRGIEATNSPNLNNQDGKLTRTGSK